jgi:flagellar motor switch protein FliM
MVPGTQLLSNEELDALSEGVMRGDIEVDTGVNTGLQVVKHDLAAEDSSLGVNVTALDMIAERFIRLFRLGMLETLRTSPRINPVKVQITRFGDYLNKLKAPLSVNIVRMQPLRGTVMVVLDPSVVFSSLDSFFGGFGSGGRATPRTDGEDGVHTPPLPAGRLFTPTESRIIRLILSVFFRSMKEAWSPVMKVEYETLGSEINPHFAQIADENDLVVVSRFESEGRGEGSGFVDMVYPYNALKPLRDVLRSRVQTNDTTEASDAQWRAELAVAVKDSALTMKVALGQLTLSMAAFENMQEGDLLYFKKPDMARISVNDVPIFDGQVGSLGVQTAVRMEQPIRMQQVPDSNRRTSDE